MRDYIDDPLINLFHKYLAVSHEIGLSVSRRKKNMEITSEQIEDMIMEHHSNPSTSRLAQLIENPPYFFTPLAFSEAFKIYNLKYCISARTEILISPDEIRQMLNIGQIVSLVRDSDLELITFDGDGTLYEDGGTIENQMLIDLLIYFLESGVTIALVTAAAYGYDFQKYEERLRKLIDRMKESNVTENTIRRLFVFGGECNYLMQMDKTYNLCMVPEKTWVQYHSIMNDPHFVNTKDIVLDLAYKTLKQVQRELNLQTRIIKKDRGVGMISGRDCPDIAHGSSGKTRIRHEILEESVLRVRNAIKSSGLSMTHCVFNGGLDVWCDIGDKSVGCHVLHKLLKVRPECSVHIGDQFNVTGNDLPAKKVMPTIFIKSPRETIACLKALKKQKEGLTSTSILDIRSSIVEQTSDINEFTLHQESASAHVRKVVDIIDAHGSDDTGTGTSNGATPTGATPTRLTLGSFDSVPRKKS